MARSIITGVLLGCVFLLLVLNTMRDRASGVASLTYSSFSATAVVHAPQITSPSKGATPIVEHRAAQAAPATTAAIAVARGDAVHATPSSSVDRRPAQAAHVTSASEHAATDPAMDATCHAHLNTGFAGDRAVVWGMTFKVASAAECCAACQTHAAACSKKGAGATHWWPARPEMTCGGNPPCNIWTFCPEEQCFAFDIHKHLRGECWLKQQLVNATRPKDPHEGHKTYPSIMRKAPRRQWPWAVAESVWEGEMPRLVPWTSGVLADAGATIVSAPPDDKWRQRWCAKHGPCTD